MFSYIGGCAINIRAGKRRAAGVLTVESEGTARYFDTKRGMRS